MRSSKPQGSGSGRLFPIQDTSSGTDLAGTLEDTLHLLGILRLMSPCALPATTALGTIHPLGREKGFRRGQTW